MFVSSHARNSLSPEVTEDILNFLIDCEVPIDYPIVQEIVSFLPINKVKDLKKIIKADQIMSINHRGIHTMKKVILKKSLEDPINNIEGLQYVFKHANINMLKQEISQADIDQMNKTFAPLLQESEDVDQMKFQIVLDVQADLAYKGFPLSQVMAETFFLTQKKLCNKELPMKEFIGLLPTFLKFSNSLKRSEFPFDFDDAIDSQIEKAGKKDKNQLKNKLNRIRVEKETATSTMLDIVYSKIQ